MVAVLLEEGSRCNLCGTANWEWQEDPHAYVPVLVTCHGCAHKEMLRGGEDAGKQPGSSIRLLPPDTAAKMAQKPSQRPPSARERAKAKR